MLDVVRVADGSRRITACPLGVPEHSAALCPLHQRLDDAVAQAEQTLGGVTIAQVLGEPLCSFRESGTAPCTRDGAGPCRPESDRRSEASPQFPEKVLSPFCDRRDPNTKCA
jgi:hypothetical protein